MAHSNSSDHAAERRWRVWVDTGGTFTDCLAVDPVGQWHRVKVLSTAALRGRVRRVEGDVVEGVGPWDAPVDFARGARLVPLGGGAGVEVQGSSSWGDLKKGGTFESGTFEGDLKKGGTFESAFESDNLKKGGTFDLKKGGTFERGLKKGGTLELAAPPELAEGDPFELRFDEEAPVLAARLVTGTAAGHALPPLAFRLATTRGTNALLERRGAPTVFFVTRGFGDLLLIGDQRRPDLFALDIRRPPPLYERVIEVPERLAADGSVLEPLDLEALGPQIAEAVAAGIESAAIALLHSYRNPSHEQALAKVLREAGLRHVSISSELVPLIKILPRAETAVVDAYLAPVVGTYLDRVAAVVGEEELHVMTSAGGLTQRRAYRAKDSLLSGPAGGVVGAARCGIAHGYERLIAFDMGGTSTDVSRFDGDHEYLFEQQVGDARVAAPALAIETVAAGGGSICRLEGRQAKVGPESAGAHPGPAAYGASGPLTLTDVHLLLGRLDASRFGIPVDEEASRASFKALLGELRGEGEEPKAEALLEGFLRIADERMADAVRRISVRRGYDPREYALVSFGGAGGLHAGSVAELLGITTVLIPKDAGLLSARGLGAAVVERFAQEQVLEPLAEAGRGLGKRLEALAKQARDAVVAEGVDPGEIVLRRRLAYLRFQGQESTVELELSELGAEPVAELEAAFDTRYRELYGYRPEGRAIELESLRAVASSHPEATEPQRIPTETRPATPVRHRRTCFGTWREVAVYETDHLHPGDTFPGPALLLDAHATTVVPPGWHAATTTDGTLVLTREEN